MGSQINRQKERWVDRKKDGQTEKKMGRQKEKWVDRKKDGQTERKMGRQKERWVDRKKDGQTERKMGIQKDRLINIRVILYKGIFLKFVLMLKNFNWNFSYKIIIEKKIKYLC